jgi:phosphatidylglycerophosphatase A
MRNDIKLHKIIASGLGTGYSPFAPGTAGAFLALIIAFIFNFSLVNIHVQETSILGLNIIVTIIVFFIGVWSIAKVHNEWKHDASKIVIDEIVGIFITILAVPLDWKYYLIGFILFRFFDILKPLGIRRIDNLKSNWSVMLDDVLAGIYSLIVLQLIIQYLL